MHTSLWRIVPLAAALVTAAPRLTAQLFQPAPLGPLFATRHELEELARSRTQRAADGARGVTEREAAGDSARGYRERLRDGDFRVGDRLVVRLTGTVTLAETLTVSASRAITLPEAGEVPLDGVLRSEVQELLRTTMARFVREVDLRVQPLVRLAVLGEVRAPGFVYVPGHALLSDVITAGGGPSVNGSLAHASVRRAGMTLMDPTVFGRALASGATLGDLDLQAGDEVYIGQANNVGWMQAIQTAAIVLGAATAYFAVRAGH